MQIRAAASLLTVWLLGCGGAGGEPSIPPGGPAPSVAPAADRPAPAASGPYFPLVAGATYEYRGTFRGAEDLTQIVVKSNGSGGFYFIDAPDAEKDVVIIGSRSFGRGVYAVDATAIRTWEAFWVGEARDAQKGEGEVLLALPPRIGAKSKAGGAELVVEGFEAVKVPAGLFEGCVSIATRSEGKDGHVWLAPGVGMVKWVRITGRVDELVRYRIPR